MIVVYESGDLLMYSWLHHFGRTRGKERERAREGKEVILTGGEIGYQMVPFVVLTRQSRSRYVYVGKRLVKTNGLQAVGIDDLFCRSGSGGPGGGVRFEVGE